MTTSIRLRLISLLTCHVLLAATVAATPPQQPNVLVVISDDQGWADIGYNNPNVYTPNLDALAATGATLTSHYVMPQCTPTRVAVMTGRYPSRFGGAALQASNEPAFPLDTPTLASMFRERGYETFLCGKWHLGSSAGHGPNHFGFDASYGSLAGAVGMYDHRYRKGEFFETWHRDLELVEGFENGIHATDLVAREAVRFIEQDRENPFFLYLAFHAVHTPLDERGRFVDQPTELDPDDPSRWRNEDEIPWFNDPAGKIQREPDPEKRLLLAALHHMDHAVGEVVAALDRAGVREETLLLFSSDNGPQVNWGGSAYPDDLKLTDFNQPSPLRGKKVDVWEGGILVPGFAHWPGRIAAKKVTTPVHIVDWFPTLANLIEYQPEPAIAWDGVDLAPLLFGDEPLSERDLYWTWNQRTNRWAVRWGDWKVVKYGTGEPQVVSDWQLFNLAQDPREQRDVAEAHPDVAAEMHRRFLTHLARDHGQSESRQEQSSTTMASDASSWPDYRGPQQDGHGPEGQFPLEWSERQNIQWKTKIDGRGWSSPIVADGLVWLTTADAQGHELAVLCLELDSGAIIFDQCLFTVEKPQFRHAFNSYASPSPVVDGDMLYVSFGSPGTACLNRRTKQVLWERTDLVCDHFRGAGSSPLVVEDLLILTMDGADFQYLIALDKLTGETMWRTDRSTDFKDIDEQTGKPAGGGDYRKSFATPIVIEVGGKHQLISPGAKAAFAYDPETGEEIWTVRYNEHSSASRTLYGQGLVFINTGYSNPTLLAVDPTGEGDVTETHVKWRLTRGVPKKPSAVLVGDHIYMVNDGGIASCVIAKTGKSVWQQRIGGEYSASLIHAGGHIYAFSEEGRAVVMKPGEEFQLIGENTLEAGCMASPAAVGSTLIVRTKTHLYRIQ